MWVYSQREGNLFLNESFVGQGYSGKGDSKNQPQDQGLTDQGPIPVGMYTIGFPVDTAMHGPFAMPLAPSHLNNMLGRFGFLIHGDSLEHPGEASCGCVILSRDVRNKIWESNDLTFVVVPSKEASVSA